MIRKWVRGGVTYRGLYRTLSEYQSLIGFWRRSGQVKSMSQPSLVVFEWGPSFVTGFRISPSKPGSYDVAKSPFLWLSITSAGAPVSFLDPNCKFEFSDDVDVGFVESGLVPVSVNFMGKRHVVVEDCLSNGGNEGGERESGLLMSEVYQNIANKTSPVGDRARRRRLWRMERRKLEPEHFVKIENCSPTPARPLQGLWKGIEGDMDLDFYLVEYDDIGGVVCRRVGDFSHPLPCYSNSIVFWTPNTSFTEPPFSPSEQYIYDSRIHVRPVTCSKSKPYRDYEEVVSRVLDINSSYDLVIADLAEVSASPRQVEGRIWQYDEGTFGFGFLRNNYIIDLQPVAQDGHLLDAMEKCSD